MPNIKDFTDALTALTAPVAGDLIYVRNAAGNRKMTVQNLLNGINTLPINRRDGGDIGGYLMDGVDDYITVPDDANLDFGLSDFSVELFVRLADYTPAAELVLLEKHASNLGYKLLLTTAGKLKLQVGNGTNFTTFSYESDATGATDDSWAHFLITADRDGNALYYVNGNLNKTVDISGSVAQTLDNAGALNVFGNGTSYTAGRVTIVRAYNRILTATEIANNYNNGRPDLYELPLSLRGASPTPKYTSDFSTNAENWSGFNLTATGNVDGVSGVDDCLSLVTMNTLETHIGIMANSAAFADLVGKTIKIQFDYFIPSANSNVDGFWLLDFGGNGSIYDAKSTGVTPATLDAWTTLSIDAFIVKNGIGFYFYLADGDLIIFQDAGGDDLLYLKNMLVTVIGNCAEYLPQNAGSLGWIESSGNQLSGATSGSPLCLTKAVRPPHYRDIRKAIAANTNTTLTGIVPRGYKIVSIRAKGSDSLADIKIGSASAGEQIVAATTTSGTTPKLLTLAATANDAYSESADVTLYARHDTGASGKTMDLIFHFEKVGN